MTSDNIEVEKTTEELDALADQADIARNSERPMTEAPSSPEKKALEDRYEFVHNGKTVKGTRDELIKWAQMGYDRPQFQQKFNQERSKWEQERQQWNQVHQKMAPYRQIDEWALKNPSQWQQLEALWKQSQTNPQILSQMQPGNVPQGTIAPELQPYLSEIQNLKQTVSQLLPEVQQWKQERAMNQQQAEDQHLEKEVQSIRETYKDLDWNSLDENGKDLEHRVMEHAESSQIPSFRAALRDLLHDDLIARAQAQAKIAVSKGIQNKTRMGVLGESPTSKSWMPDRNKNIKDTSYEEIEQEIREEIRRGKAS